MSKCVADPIDSLCDKCRYDLNEISQLHSETHNLHVGKEAE